MRIAFFDDDATSYAKLSNPLKAEVEPSASVDRYNPSDVKKIRAQKHLSESILAYLLKPSQADLVVVDYDLTAYDPPLPSELVQKVCEEEGFPVCLYTFQNSPRKKAQYLLRWREHAIALDMNQPKAQCAELIASYSRGFERIKSVFLSDSSGQIGKVSDRILQPPEGASLRLEQYQWGGSVPLRILQLSRNSPKTRTVRSRTARFQTAAFGYWVVNELFQFPGALLNEVAAASYLDVSPEEFSSRPELQAYFNEAKYTGPFSEVAQYWWTTKLEGILAQGATPDDKTIPTGYDFLTRRGQTVSHCSCLEGHSPAGFYCVLTHKPVCADHSIKPLAVFPVGADKSRISNRVARRLLPLVSM